MTPRISSGRDRRVASYRTFLSFNLNEAEQMGLTQTAKDLRDLILALRKPERVASEKAFEEACAACKGADRVVKVTDVEVLAREVLPNHCINWFVESLWKIASPKPCPTCHPAPPAVGVTSVEEALDRLVEVTYRRLLAAAGQK